ncbi:hypothetical protein [Varibaculum cambriense]|uniref:hypothetical protein n=1 Tax=Varibaculum cambriense TaxID=184870 RepID=UPI00290D3B45|nr:hypothetical protein [Varibaculum cambriense]MDU3273869.1 hypothetical protein [Varibaculum cambriense]
MTFEEAALIPSAEELDEIWDFVINQSEIDSPFGNIVKSELELLPSEPDTIFICSMMEAINQDAPVPRGVIEFYRYFMDEDKLDRMDLEDLVVADE